MAIASGHGTGKSAMGAWLTNWILSTRPDSLGTVTAGTWKQLETRTWAAIQRWTRLCITGHWFHVQANGIFHKGRPKAWNVTPQTCKEENAQAFAGQHALTSTSWYMFDEASLVPDKVWEVAQGGLTDGQPMWFAWGQPERNSGKFFEVTSGKLRKEWMSRRFDSRSSRLTNKDEIEEWRQTYGEDSDYFRVRVMGLPPAQDELQFIDSARIKAAQQREAVVTFDDEPLIAGFDASGGGKAWAVIRFRRGLDARPGPRVPAPIRVPGEQTRDRNALIAKLAGVMRDEHPDRKVAAMFVDSAFGAPYVERLHVLGYSNVIEVTFGAPSPDRHMGNMRAYMWNAMKEWLPKGAIGPADDRLAIDLGAPGATVKEKTGKLFLESKAEMQARGFDSPDDGDALALTFAQHVGPVEPKDEEDEEEQFLQMGGNFGARPGGWMR